VTASEKLLEKAKGSKQAVTADVERYLDLWLAVLNSEVDVGNVLPVLGYSSKEYNRYYNWFTSTGKRLVKQGLVRVYKVQR